MFQFSSTWKQKKTFRFLVFWESIQWQHSREMDNAIKLGKKLIQISLASKTLNVPTPTLMILNRLKLNIKDSELMKVVQVNTVCWHWSCICLLGLYWSKVAIWRCSVKKMLLKILRNSEGNTRTRASLSKRFFPCEFCETFKNSFFGKQLRTADSLFVCLLLLLLLLGQMSQVSYNNTLAVL